MYSSEVGGWPGGKEAGSLRDGSAAAWVFGGDPERRGETLRGKGGEATAVAVTVPAGCADVFTGGVGGLSTGTRSGLGERGAGS